MTSPTRKNEAKRRKKNVKKGARRKRAIAAAGSTLSAEKLFEVKKG
jgi:hypothetical protein